MNARVGVSDEAAKGAREEEGFVVGISPAKDFYEHINVYKLPYELYDTIIFTGFGFNQRNIVNIRTSDAVIYLRGSMGTLNEFTIGYEDGKIIGVLENMGGISEFFDEIIKICKKESNSIVVFDSDPKKLVEKLVALVKERVYTTKKVKKIKQKG